MYEAHLTQRRGWLLTEPFIVPALYEKYVNTSSIAIVDEWTLSIAMGTNLASEMEEHYKTFIVRPSDLSRSSLPHSFVPDRGRLCKDRRSRPQLGAHPNRILGLYLFSAQTSEAYTVQAIEAINDEPFLVGTSWTYFLKA
jgi:glucan 1,3-beta-glucosidase